MTFDVYNPPDAVLPETRLAVRRSHLLDEVERSSGRRLRLTQWFRRQPRTRRVILALALLVLIGGVGTALGVGVNLLARDVAFHKRYGGRAAFEPKPVSSFVYITRGSDWALIAWKSNRGICLDYAYEDAGNRFGFSGWSGCGMPVVGSPPDRVFKQSPYTDLVGIVMGSDKGIVTVSGPVAPGVATVKVELDSGKLLGTTIYGAPPKLHTRLRFYLLRAPTSSVGPPRVTRPSSPPPVRAIRAYDSGGRLLQRKTLR